MSHHRSRNAKSGLSAIRLALVFFLLLLSAFTGYAAPPPADDAGFTVVALPASALAMPVDLAQALSAASNPKMDSDLAALASAGSASSGDALTQAQSSGLRFLGDRVQVKITTHPEGVQAVTEAVVAAGGEVTGRANGDTWLQAWVPVPALDTIAAEADVYYISRPAEAFTMATTEGLAVINGPAWHAAGLRGAGVKVAIIDGGFQGYPGLRGTELPATVTAKNFVDGETDTQVNGTTVHGTACAEIVHDIAPDAALYLVKVGTDIDLQQAVDWLKTQGVNIISTSLGWYNLTPGDGTGFFANLVQSARTAGIFWTTAASNDREAHWGGAYSDLNGNNTHNFAGTQEINFFGPGTGTAYNIPSGYPIRVFLRWDDWSAVNQNYSLSIVKWNGSSWTIVATGNNPQNGGAGQSPTEFAAYTTSGSAAPYGFIVQRVSSSRNVNMEIFAPKVARLDELVTARSLANLADAPAAMTVAALDVNAPYPQESYSSEGPTNGPGGSAAGGAIKPDIAGFANVSTASYPNPAEKFNGTSSATPHVAGAAALVKGANPAYTPAQIQSFLQGRAVDMGSAGKDTIYGYGRLYLGAAPGPVSTRKTFLPLVRKSPSPPAAPVLNPIDNADGDGNYTVGWSAVAGATSYTLEEDDNAGFTSPTTQYTGTATSWGATGKAVGTYYYRAKATNTAGSSGWSATQSTTVNPSGGWTTIINTDFEGAWPGPWVVDDNDGATGGEYYWGKRNCRAYSGSYSGWGVGAGAQGSALGCGADYPDDADSWMKYGPFSLANTTAADLSFKLWMNSEKSIDKVCRFASVDGANYWGTCTSGNTDGWTDRVLDLSNVFTLGNLLGQPSVWIAIVFYSDSSTTFAEGGYVDDIVLRKCPSGATCPAGLLQAIPSDNQVSESSEHMALPR